MRGAVMENWAELRVTPLRGLPMFTAGMDLANELAKVVDQPLRCGDIVVVAQKIVSKAEGRAVSLSTLTPGGEANRLAEETERPPSLVQLILDESEVVMRATKAAIIVRHRTGHVLANAGIDASNVAGGDADTVLLWPRDPDASARRLRARLAEMTGARPAVVIADSLGRAWRIGTVGTAIGCAGLVAVEDRRGEQDLFGRILQATVIGVADSIAALATLVMGEGAEGTPAAIVRGAGHWVTDEDGPGAASAIRPLGEDMFR
jgi:coenzyme F420-0:L-glutamate ligase/coenzyme F420-1:gamma-L-glutamate ligase